MHVVHYSFSKIWKLAPMLCFEMTPFAVPYNLHIQDLITFCSVFVLHIGTKEFCVSVGCIKPVYVLADDPPSSRPSLPTPGPSRPTITTHSGRVHFTVFFQP
ncbi:hypothetical protein TNCT_577941 [Trichonephila clavata]|uniref:Uncharacterized protein n=1 Tax=Trichonephila clavata TaxID=2740835 RepID=A0A8X6LGL0_TRICU|nr:hypothetical protein TNCT_577941 [Trichonephila clavata]